MDPGEFVPAGESAPGPDSNPPGLREMQAMPRVREGLILPVVFAVATWAVDRFTSSALGDWRYIPVALLGLCAIYFSILALVIATVLSVAKSDGREAPRWRVRTVDVLLVALIVAAVIVACVEAVRDNSFIDAGTALVIVVWAGFIRRSTLPAAERRGPRRGYRLAVLLLPVWVIAVDVFRLR